MLATGAILPLAGSPVSAVGSEPGDLPFASAPGGPAHHGATTLACSQCHQSAAPAGSADLKTGDVNTLCLSCHDGIRGIPDVAGADINGLRDRSAGEFSLPGAPRGSGHRLGHDLTCITCHDPHGNGNPRDLRLPSGTGPDPRFGLFVGPGVNGLSRYERQNVAYGTTDSPACEEVTALCLDCHDNLSGSRTRAVGPKGGDLLHPSYDSREGATATISETGGIGASDPGYWNLGTGPEFAMIGRVPFLA